MIPMTELFSCLSRTVRMTKLFSCLSRTVRSCSAVSVEQSEVVQLSQSNSPKLFSCLSRTVRIPCHHLTPTQTPPSSLPPWEHLLQQLHHQRLVHLLLRLPLRLASMTSAQLQRQSGHQLTFLQVSQRLLRLGRRQIRLRHFR